MGRETEPSTATPVLTPASVVTSAGIAGILIPDPMASDAERKPESNMLIPTFVPTDNSAKELPPGGS